MQSLIETIRHAARRLRRSPGYSIPVVLSLALGIGLNTAVFSVVSNVLLRPLPFRAQGDLVTAGVVYFAKGETGTPSTSWNIFPVDLEVWRRDKNLFTQTAVFTDVPRTVEGDRGPEFVPGGGASANLLDVLGTRVSMGRWFAPGEEGLRYVVISDDLWRRQYAADRNIIGRTLRIQDEPWTIIGVMPRNAALPLDAQFWQPTTGFGAQMIARPKPHLPLSTIARALNVEAPSYRNAAKFGDSSAVVVVPLHDQLFGSAAPSLRFVTAAALLLLLIACANIANLSLARALEQRRETAVRIALGASRRSLAAMILAENSLLAIVGAVAGGIIAVWATRLLVAIGSDDVIRVEGISVDGRSIAFAIALAILTALVVSLAPMFVTAHRDVRPALGQNSRQGGSNAFRGIRRGLVAAQLALTLLLLTGAGLLIRSVSRLTDSAHLGFSPHGVVISSVGLYGPRYRNSETRGAFERALMERVRALPFARSVGMGPSPLVGGRGTGLREGFNSIIFTYDSAHQQHRTWAKYIDEGYLDTYRLRLVAGRNFRPSDDSTAERVALLNRAAVKLYFKDRPALGQILPGRKGLPKANDMGADHRIVGIVDDVLQRDLAMNAEAEIYLPSRQERSYALNFAVRTSAAIPATINAIRDAIRATDPHVAAQRIEPMDEVVKQSLARHTFLLYLMGAFAGLALALSVLGLYAIVSYLVAQRTFEIGLRMALGAQRHDILGLVLGEAGMLVGIGLLIGIPTAFALSRLIASFLYEVKAHDVVAFAGAPVLLALVAVIAAFRPARRALSLDPAQTLRAD